MSLYYRAWQTRLKNCPVMLGLNYSPVKKSGCHLNWNEAVMLCSKALINVKNITLLNSCLSVEKYYIINTNEQLLLKASILHS